MKTRNLVPLGDFIEQIRGVSYKPSEIRTKSEEDYLPILRASNFDEEGLNTKGLIYIHKSRINENQLIKAGDILIASSSGSKEVVGKSIQFKEDFHGSFGAFCKLIRVKQGFATGYVGHFFKSKVYKNAIRKSVQGANINNLRNEHIDSLQIPRPSIADQIRIDNILSRAELLIHQRKESLRLLDEFLKSTFLEMFGDPVKNEKGWERVPLADFGQIITGNTPPRNDARNYSSRFVEWIKSDNILSDQTFVTEASEYLSEIGASRARLVNRGALLVTCIAGSIESIGRSGLTNRTVSFNQQINAIQPTNEIESLFLLWLFRLSKSYIQNHASKGMKKILTKGDFEKILMIKPPSKLQRRFSQISEKVETLRARYQNSLVQLEKLYDSLSQRVISYKSSRTNRELSLMT